MKDKNLLQMPFPPGQAENPDYPLKQPARSGGSGLPLLDYYRGFLPGGISDNLKKFFLDRNCNLEFATWVNPADIGKCLRRAGNFGFHTWISLDRDCAFLYGAALINTERKLKETLGWLDTITCPGACGHIMFNDSEKKRQLIRLNSSAD